MSTLEALTTPLSTEQRQAVRMRRFLLAAYAYLIACGLLLVAYAIDFTPGLPVAFSISAIVLGNLGVYALIRSGYNLRFADPSLTRLQMFIALSVQMYITFNLDEGRGLALVFTFIIFLFGVYRLDRREFIPLILYAVASYGLVVNLLFALRPEAVTNAYLEWFSWLLLVLVLPGFGLIGGHISELRDRLRVSHAELSNAFRTIQTMATRDALTGLHNRTALTDGLQHALAQSARHGRKIGVLFMDLDRFKAINDTLGHSTGDRVLREVADRIKRCVRESDIVARLGGDEFVVVVEGFQARADLETVARKLVEAMGKPLRLDERELPMSVSIGVAASPQDGQDVQTLLRNGDAAMYHAKHNGRNGYALYSSGMVERAAERLALQAELRYAIERQELRLYYQPKVDVFSERITGVEALLRWQHPRLGLLAPNQFIALAEESGAITDIGVWVLRTACEQAQAWRAQHDLVLNVAVNLSPRQFQDQRLPAMLEAALSASGLPSSQLVLELTEGIAMQNPELAARQMAELVQRGVRIAIDDFGTGYSSLGYLKRFPLSSVKIDRSFVHDLPHHADDVAIVRAVIAMAHSLKLSVTAEGVERIEQLELLRHEGCEEYQGFLCSPAIEAPRLLQLVKGDRGVRKIA